MFDFSLSNSYKYVFSNFNSHVESYINWLQFSRCKKQVTDTMANKIIFNRGDNAKMMNALCQGLSNLVHTCSHDILNKCFNFDTIQEINTALLTNMRSSIENLKVFKYYGKSFRLYIFLKT